MQRAVKVEPEKGGITVRSGERQRELTRAESDRGGHGRKEEGAAEWEKNEEEYGLDECLGRARCRIAMRG